MLVVYSARMDQSKVPMITERYPHPDYRIGKAWQALYTILRDSGEPVEGRAIVDAVASQYNLAPATLTNLLSRAAKAGLLRSELRYVRDKVTRKHAFYEVVK